MRVQPSTSGVAVGTYTVPQVVHFTCSSSCQTRLSASRLPAVGACFLGSDQVVILHPDHDLASILPTANRPRPCLRNRLSFPFAAISRMTATYSVALGVAPLVFHSPLASISA